MTTNPFSEMKIKATIVLDRPAVVGDGSSILFNHGNIWWAHWEGNLEFNFLVDTNSVPDEDVLAQPCPATS